MTMPNVQTWLIRLTPCSAFYFGGDRHFSAGDHGGVNYFVRSNFFPQQTGLLGMLRFLLLRENQLLPLNAQNQSGAKQLIGEESFDPFSSTIQNFGAIRKISPLFIDEMDDEGNVRNRWFRAAREFYTEIPSASKYKSLTLAAPIQASFNRSDIKDFLPAEAPYRGKYELPELLASASGNELRHLEFEPAFNYFSGGIQNGLFQADWRIGISIKNREEAFYKQCYYRFVRNEGQSYALGFYAQLGSQIQLPKSTLVQIGGERAPFHFEALRADSNNPFDLGAAFYGNLYQNGYRGTHKVVLLSDARLDPSVFNIQGSFLTSGVYFSNYRTIVDKTLRYDTMQRHTGLLKDQPVRSVRHYLVSAGSVFYTTDFTAVENALNAFPTFSNIGYNHFITIPKAI